MHLPRLEMSHVLLLALLTGLLALLWWHRTVSCKVTRLPTVVARKQIGAQPRLLHPDLLFLSRMSRRYGCSSRGCAPMYSHAIIVGSLVILHGIAQCHPSRASIQVSRARSRKWLISSQDRCTIPPSRPSLREHQ